MTVIVGASLGAAVVGLAVALAAVIVCLVCRRKRGNTATKPQPSHQETVLGNNPVYEGAGACVS